ncbi:IS630 family transposase [Moorena sp. SIO4G3]|uniref:IS630 family transposase n=1 Tax=Moorena sp. SIO4G3 TaxID=2607821 RepID=UPI0025F89627|nr:IS630 family transposase [Moorena sp. SIO4G3]
MATHLHSTAKTVRKTLNAWKTKGLGGLWEASGRGRQRRWSETDIEYLEDCLRIDPRSYNSVQLAEKLSRERQVDLSPEYLRDFPQKKGVIWKRMRVSHQKRQDPHQRLAKKNDLEMLELAAAADEIDLLYLDESGCCLWSAVSYSYYFKGEQKRLEQTKKRGKRLSLLGLWQPLVTFICSLVLGSWKSEDFIKLMEEQAQVAGAIYQRTGRIRVITLDNGSIHKSSCKSFL